MDFTKRRLSGRAKNKHLRYRAIMEEFNKYNVKDIPIAVIHRKYIYPKFFISRATLYTILKKSFEQEQTPSNFVPSYQLALFDDF